MAVNKYFDNIGAENEQELLEDLVIESIKISGVDIYYIPRVYVNKDMLFGEVPISRFKNAYVIETYLESYDKDQGQGAFLAKFGLEQRDAINLSVSKRRFKEVITEYQPQIIRPREGDLIHVPFIAKGFFEIKFVEDKNPYFQLGQRYLYIMKTELFRYSSEEFNTGVDEVDKLATEKRNLDSVSKDEFSKNEEIEDQADGGLQDLFNDTGKDDRGTGAVNFDENSPFGSY